MRLAAVPFSKSKKTRTGSKWQIAKTDPTVRFEQFPNSRRNRAGANIESRCYPSAMRNTAGEVVVSTGASRGLGEATSQPDDVDINTILFRPSHQEL
jgi:hypothetical protein